ncbi:MAG: 2-hydroxychromene-2-carboxylate isomerase [Pseudomonadota bacterium]
MPRQFEFLYDIVSPTAYLAWYSAPETANSVGAEIVYTPIFLGGIMQGAGNTPPGMVPAKGRYLSIDVPRCAAHIGVPYHLNPAFPVNTLGVQRATVGMDDPDERNRFAKACFDYTWGRPDPLNLGTDDALQALCAAEGFDFERIKTLATDPANKAKLKANTDHALERGVFGAPTFFVGDEIFFGHDRLDYVARAVEAAN